LEITDDGVGISPQLLPRVFDLFGQSDRAIDRSQGGLGIGLSVVKRLVQMHGGEVRARSDGEGHGATFEIRLPRIERHEATPRKLLRRRCLISACWWLTTMRMRHLVKPVDITMLMNALARAASFGRDGTEAVPFNSGLG
jgi:hypothetical protein